MTTTKKKEVTRVDGRELTLTVSQLRAALAGLPDELEVVIRGQDSADESVHYMAGVVSAQVESGCCERDALILDCDVQADSRYCISCEEPLNAFGVCDDCGPTAQQRPEEP